MRGVLAVIWELGYPTFTFFCTFDFYDNSEQTIYIMVGHFYDFIFDDEKVSFEKDSDRRYFYRGNIFRNCCHVSGLITRDIFAFLVFLLLT